MPPSSVPDELTDPDTFFRGGPAVILFSLLLIAAAPVFRLVSVLFLGGVLTTLAGAAVKATNWSKNRPPTSPVGPAVLRVVSIWQSAYLLAFLGLAVGWATEYGRSFLVLGSAGIGLIVIGKGYLEFDRRSAGPGTLLADAWAEFRQQPMGRIVWRLGAVVLIGAYLSQHVEIGLGAEVPFYLSLVLLTVGWLVELIQRLPAGRRVTPPVPPGSTGTQDRTTRSTTAGSTAASTGDTTPWQPESTPTPEDGPETDVYRDQDDVTGTEVYGAEGGLADSAVTTCPHCGASLAGYASPAYCPDCGEPVTSAE